LLEEAHVRREGGQLQLAATLAYLALKAADEAAQPADAALANLFLSECMGALGYRAMERIHAKKALHSHQHARAAGADRTGGPFYARLGSVALRTGDLPVAGYYLAQALAAHEAAAPRDPAALSSVLLDLSTLAMERARLANPIDRDGVAQLQLAADLLDRARSAAEPLPAKDPAHLRIRVMQAQ
jgi:hypothetical protein